MKEKLGEIFSIAKDNQPVAGCTISKEVHDGSNYIIYFSLAKNTDIIMCGLTPASTEERPHMR